MHTYDYLYICMCVCVCVCVCVCLCVWVLECVCVTHTHTHIHSFIGRGHEECGALAQERSASRRGQCPGSLDVCMMDIDR
jgi:hypothetical protein